MRKQQKQKVIAIVALCISILGLTLGFAAFSNTLTISSSATVTPDSSDFKLVIYGVPNLGEYDQHKAGMDDNDYRTNLVLPISKFTSTTTAEPILFKNKSTISNVTGKKATIINNGNGTFAIKDLSITFTEPGQGAEYYFILKNEGNYDAYFNVMDIPTPTKTCEAGTGTTASLVTQACQHIGLTPLLSMEYNGEYNPEQLNRFVDERGNVKIPVGGHAMFSVVMSYGSSGARADGPFSVTWSDLTYTFTTNAQ